MALSMAAKLLAAGVVIAAAGLFYTGFYSLNLPQRATPAQQGGPQKVTRNVQRVIVIGSGLAGTAAALAAAEAGAAEVLVLEKEARPGGNSMKASSGINALSPDQGDTAKAFREDTLKSGGGLSSTQLVDALVGDSEDAVSWLEGQGVDLSGWVQLGGHSKKRTHTSTKGPVGVSIMKALLAKQESQLNIRVVTGAKVRSLLRGPQGQGVYGAVYTAADGTTQRVEASAVILASGGFGANADLLKKFAPETAELPTTNGAWAQGDGLMLAVDAGAILVHLDRVQVHPTGFVDPAEPDSGTKFLAPEKLRGVGGILLNNDARRFVDELATRDVVSAAVSAQPDREAYLVLGAAAAEQFGPGMNFYLSKGLFERHEGVEALERATGLPGNVLTLELASYNEAAAAGQDAFGKKVFPTTVDPNGAFYVSRITPVVHYTMGGVAISPQGQALDMQWTPIPGLYAAGEASGGVHGANRLGGNSLLECVVFGRRAGRAAAAFSEAATTKGFYVV